MDYLCIYRYLFRIHIVTIIRRLTLYVGTFAHCIVQVEISLSTIGTRTYKKFKTQRRNKFTLWHLYQVNKYVDVPRLLFFVYTVIAVAYLHLLRQYRTFVVHTMSKVVQNRYVFYVFYQQSSYLKNESISYGDNLPIFVPLLQLIPIGIQVYPLASCIILQEFYSLYTILFEFCNVNMCIQRCLI